MKVGICVKVLLLVLCCWLLWPGTSVAKESTCADRYLTLVNPIRGRNLWLDQTLEPIKNQYQLLADHHLAATWLWQYDALADQELIEYAKHSFSAEQELGLFLEVSPALAQKARVIYPHGVPWFAPQAVFLSGYSQSERRRLIDTMFARFTQEFNRVPKAVGAWWVDAYSLDYMHRRYGIESVLIVADQTTTDNYGVWGQWWGVPYFPSKANSLVPAQTQNDQHEVVLMQWAQRDISRALGAGPSFSNYSLQANDYTERGQTTDYFKRLTGNYLDCALPLGQITVGLETGIESVRAFEEYQKQIAYLSTLKHVRNVTMSGFAKHFKDVYMSNPAKLVLSDSTSQWVLTPQERVNEVLGDKVSYQNNLAFADYFVPDTAGFLDRKLPMSVASKPIYWPFVLPLIFGVVFGVFAKLDMLGYFWPVATFILLAYWPLVRSYSRFGRAVYFGPVVANIMLTQVLTVLVSFGFLGLLIRQLKSRLSRVGLWLWCVVLAFGLDWLAVTVRYIQLQDERYFGLARDALAFVGLKFGNGSLAWVNRDFPPVEASSMLRLDLDIFWHNHWLAFIVYPLAHVGIGTLLYLLVVKMPKKMQIGVLFVFLVLVGLFIHYCISLEPRIVQ